MRLQSSRSGAGLCLAPLFAIVSLASAEAVFHFHVVAEEPGAWPRILSSAGWLPGAGGIYVLRAQAELDPWKQRIADGAIVIVEGESPLATSLGITPNPGKPVPVRNVTDIHNPKLPIIWEKTLDLPTYDFPPSARVFARERWHNTPLLAAVPHGKGALLWLATSPGQKGYERFPYLLQALVDLGVHPPFQSRRLWAFFDASYRSRVDPDYFAERWRSSGIAALHVASWHFYDPDPERDVYLKKLIEACHRQAILVYAWIELPHVSERFWNDHPEWREKTAILQDAHLDWRRLMNLQNPDSARAAAAGLEQVLTRFDWDGINLAELYFESLEGHANPSRFTPMNDDVRREFKAAHGLDPKEIFDSKDTGSMRTFLDWRADLARRMQEHWIGEMDRIRKKKPHLDLVLTHVDDRYDTGMRDLIGADAARLLPLLDRHDFTFLIEDPATVWHLGPDRYPDIAARYLPITPKPNKLAIDINIVERYQDVYPTKQQTGVELLQLVQMSSRAFPRVALYFEFSILPPDLPLLASATAAPDRVQRLGSKLVVESKQALGVPWRGPASVNGQLWAFQDEERLWLPAGAHVIEASQRAPALRILDFSAQLRSIASLKSGIEFSYQSDSRAWVVLDRSPSTISLDGESLQPVLAALGTRVLIVLPKGQHWVTISAD